MFNNHQELTEAVIPYAVGYPSAPKITGLSDSVIDAFRKVDRGLFVESGAYGLGAVGIPCGQTCSEPNMVAHMPDMAKLAPGQRVLSIGTGCGYADAHHLLLISPGGTLRTLERYRELVDHAKENLIRWYLSLSPEQLGNSKKHEPDVSMTINGFNIDFVISNRVTRLEMRYENGYFGDPRCGPYDRIIATAGALPDFDDTPLIRQLATPGTLIYPPKEGKMQLVHKLATGIERHPYGYVRFVDFVPP